MIDFVRDLFTGLWTAVLDHIAVAGTVALVLVVVLIIATHDEESQR